MAVRKYVNVATTKYTAEASAGVTVTHFRITASDGTTVKTKFQPLANSRTLEATQRMEIKDRGIYVENPTASHMDDTWAITRFDADFANTDLIQWSANGTTATGSLAATEVGDWEAAATV